MATPRLAHIGAIAVLMALAGCDGRQRADDPVGNGMPDADIAAVSRDAAASKAPAPDPAVIRTRRIAGAWQGTGGGEDVAMTFGNDGSLSIETTRDGAIADAATGSWRWTAGNTLAGETTGATGGLSRYAEWTAAFAGDARMNVSGTGGAIMTLNRKRGPGGVPAR